MINIIGKRYWFFLISAIVIVPGIISLIVFGLKPRYRFSERYYHDSEFYPGGSGERRYARP